MARQIGWDIGGAHLKAALAVDGAIVRVAQFPTPLWQGLDTLHAAIADALAVLGPATGHAVTMTGELADAFANRAEGVARIIAIMAAALPGALIYGGRAGWIAPAAASAHAPDIASANWHATAALLARHQPEALLIDMGSTTTDIIPIVAGQVAAIGYSDAERLASGELVYTGLTRAHPMAVAQRAPFAGRWTGLANEYFASMADARRILGDLPAGADQMPQPDGRGQSLPESIARLARMVGHDAADASPAAWRGLAAWFSESQLRQVQDGAFQVLSRGILDETAPIVIAGLGQAMVAEAARRLGRAALDFATALGLAEAPAWLTECAPAGAVALLLARNRSAAEPS